MDPLKEMFDRSFYSQLAIELHTVEKKINSDQFTKDALKNIELLSLNERMRNTSVVLKKHLPNNYQKSIELLKQVIPKLKPSYTNLVFPDFVAQFGIEYFDDSMRALHYFTQYGSSEFAIRFFLKKDFDKTIRVMSKWAEDENLHVRRLSSEGCRPRLPWSFKLDVVIKNPYSTLPILEKLKTDNELYVKKSVANHLNDISKDHPDFLIDHLKKWDINHQHTSWIIKHACRTQIKKGNKKALAILGFEKKTSVVLSQFKLNKKNFQLPDILEFQFKIAETKGKAQKLAIDYIIHYRKKTKNLSPKVFKLKEIILQPNESQVIIKKQVLKDFSTRKHVKGIHFIEIMINGEVFVKQMFQLQ